MRRLVILLALIAGSAFFFGAVGAPVASAGSCSASTNAISWDAPWGQYKFTGFLTSCSGVNAVQFGSPTSCCGYDGFIWDASVGLGHYATNGGGTIVGVYGTYTSDYHVSNWGLTCPSIVHSVSSYFSYRIRSTPGSTWGAWHQYGGIRYELIC